MVGREGRTREYWLPYLRGGGEKVGNNWTELVTLFERWLGEGREELDRTGYPI